MWDLHHALLVICFINCLISMMYLVSCSVVIIHTSFFFGGGTSALKTHLTLLGTYSAKNTPCLVYYMCYRLFNYQRCILCQAYRKLFNSKDVFVYTSFFFRGKPQHKKYILSRLSNMLQNFKFKICIMLLIFTQIIVLY